MFNFSTKGIRLLYIVFFFFFFAVNCRRCCSGNFRIWFWGHGFWDLGSQLWGLDFHTRGFQDRNLKTFFFFFSFPSFFRPKLPSSTDRVFFFLSALNCRRWRIGFFFSLFVRPRLSITTCSTLHPSDVGFFTSFNEENLATFTSCSIFKTFVPTYLPTRGDGFEVKEKKKKASTGGLCPIVTGTH